MKKALAFFFLVFLLLPGMLGAQNNYFIDKLMDEKEATFGDAAFIALAAAGKVRADAAVADAMKFLETSKWGLTGKAEAPITLGELCFILMKGFDMSGGMMYAMFPGPRYATREFEYLGIVRRNTIPSRRVSGEEVMQIIGRLLTMREEAAQ